MGRVRAGRDRSPFDVIVVSVGPLERYLVELGELLRGDKTTRHEVLMQIEEHVLDAIEAGEDEAIVVARLGDARGLAQDFNASNSDRWASGRRRFVLAMVGAVAMVGAMAESTTRLTAPRVPAELAGSDGRVAARRALDPRSGTFVYRSLPPQQPPGATAALQRALSPGAQRPRSFPL